ncbi:MAG: methyltransferase domain-containing protein [Nocardioides sp.]|jgi:23S rRNA (uracil747-C5)-methyltransferase
MQCDYYDAGLCRSCTLLPIPYASQLAAKSDRARELLPAVADWLAPVSSPQEGFRNKAKLVVAGGTAEPTLGILGPDGTGTDLRWCALHAPALTAALPELAGFITGASLQPYDVTARTGELKHLLVTISPDSELMVRFVLRSTEAETRIRKHLRALLAALPAVRVVSLNIQPEHKAVLEGAREIVLTEAAELPMRINDLTLLLRPQSFFQTNTEIAAALYRSAVAWTADLPVESVLDLYCGVGGFGLHLASRRRRVLGVEVSAEAVESARLSAAEAGLEARFEVGDAASQLLSETPELVVVNPPRRGIGTDLARRLSSSEVPYVLYSSCNAESLARDLELMPTLMPVRGQIFDMFPNTEHFEVLVLLQRNGLR